MQQADPASGWEKGQIEKNVQDARREIWQIIVPDLDRHLAAYDLALVQGGLTTCLELTAAGTPFLYFPPRNHFEHNVHVAQRLDRHGAGRRMTYAAAAPETIAEAIVDACGHRPSAPPSRPTVRRARRGW